MDQTYPHGTWVYQNTTSSDRRVLSNRNEVCYQQGRERNLRSVMQGKKLASYGWKPEGVF